MFSVLLFAAMFRRRFFPQYPNPTNPMFMLLL